MKKQLDEPFFSYWNGKSQFSLKKDNKSETEIHADEHYLSLKKAIQQEALNRWSLTSSEKPLIKQD
ncbi:hypothetical protein [Halalkalibacter nanhaiisediminis]|uniref:Uncharacterized protein n=1 Tax=Halalkalibacter nanhaiisediminis TaxID=688079 RepID=A0A562QKE2_9BACI|nr:hypothetical protein [Halalkalibacter nanhaiisediminis]TWI57194.1 hypothetical protein IQ10_01900 [Halalkalibacter nanhaiisediminis]